MAIFDCFTFFNELDLLEMRFEMLSPCVDHFVLVESSKTHHGEDKPLYYFDNRELYKAYWDKIIYVQVNDPPRYKGETDMGIVNFLRNCIMRGLVEKCRPDDLVIVSDVDEIPNPEILKHIRTQRISLYANRGSWKRRLRQYLRTWAMFSGEFIKSISRSGGFTVDELLNYTPISLEYDLFYYYMDCKSRAKWLGPYIAKYSHMMMPHEPRELAYQRQLPVVGDAGWNFSYLGGLTAVKAKLAALSDPDPELEKKIRAAGSSDGYIRKCLDEGVDILGRKGKEYEFHFIDKSLIGIKDIAKYEKKYPLFLSGYKMGDIIKR